MKIMKKIQEDSIRHKTLKLAIFNFVVAWKEVEVKTLKNGWKDLLDDEDADLDLEELEVTDQGRTIQNIGGEVTEKDAVSWLKEDEGDPGYHIMTGSEIADEAITWEGEDGRENNEEEETACPKIKLSVIRLYLHDLITVIDKSSDNKSLLSYTHFCHFRELIIKTNVGLQKFKKNLIVFSKQDQLSAAVSDINVTPQQKCGYVIT